MENSRKRLLRNTTMLYILIFANYFFSFIVVPYETRILGLANYGRIGLATAMMVYVQLLLDFGILISATEQIAKNIDDSGMIKKIYTSITLLKIFLSVIATVILLCFAISIKQYRRDIVLYVLYLLSAIINSFLPDYLYRGLEHMKAITYRTVSTKAIFTGLVLVFVKSPNDIYVIPILLCIGNLLAVLWSFYDIRKTFKLSFCRVSIKDVWLQCKQSFVFFLSRIMTTVYTATNTMILGVICTNDVVGLYSTSDKLISTGKAGLSPISDSIYPYMVKNHDFSILKRILIILMIPITIVCILMFIYARPLCRILFGFEFQDADTILQAMLPQLFFALPTYLLGFPTLSAMGITRYANMTIFVSASFHILQLLILVVIKRLGVLELAVCTSITAFVEFAYRAFVIFRHRNILKEKNV